MRSLLRRLAPLAAAGAAATAAAVVPLAATPAHAGGLTTPSATTPSATMPSATTPSLIICQTATLWGNYDGTHSSDPIATLPYGTRVGWRYNDGGDDMVLWYQGSVWGFVEASCVAVGAG